MYAATGFSRSIGQMHKLVCFMLDNLIKDSYLSDYIVLYYNEKELKDLQKKDWDLGSETEKGYVKGIELVYLYG